MIKRTKESTLQIEKGILMPPTRQSGMTKVLRAMEVGDSILLSSFVVRASFIQLARKLRPKKFATRKLENGKYRGWRIE